MHDFMLNVGRFLDANALYFFVIGGLVLVYLDARHGAQPLQ